MDAPPSAHTPPGLEAAPLRALRREVLRFFPFLLGIFLVLVLLRTLFFETVPVNGPSMDPTLRDGDRLLVWKLPALLSSLPVVGGFEPFALGDIVVFRGIEGERKRYVKRVVALGGGGYGPTQVQVEGNEIFVNNQRLQEAYLPPEQAPSDLRTAHALNEGDYYLLGDNRGVSKDSRRFGPVPRADIVGKAVACLWPPSRFGPL